MALITNATYEAQLLKMCPQYAQYTADGTFKLFDSAGFLDDTLSNVTQLNEVFNCLNRITLNIINVADVVDAFAIGDFGEHFKDEFGAATQRMAIMPMKPVNPQFRNIGPNGVNMQNFRVPEVEDRYFKVNFDFQNFYSLSEFQIRQMFTSERGIPDFYAGFMRQMSNSYIEQKHMVVKETLNALINDTVDPLQDTQKIALTSWSATPTAAELKDFIQKVKKVVSDMKATTSTAAYNQKKFKTHQDVSRLRLLCRVGLKDLIETEVLAPVFHDNRLSLPFEIIEVEDFGGLIAGFHQMSVKNFTGDGATTEFTLDYSICEMGEVTINGTATTAYTYVDHTKKITFDTAPGNGDAIVVNYRAQMWPVYASAAAGTTDIHHAEGEVIGWNNTEGSTVAAHTDDQIVYIDPNADVLALLVDKGIVFEIEHNAPRLIAAPYNAAGLYVTNWFSAPGNEIHGDKLYTLVAFKKPSA